MIFFVGGCLPAGAVWLVGLAARMLMYAVNPCGVEVLILDPSHVRTPQASGSAADTSCAGAWCVFGCQSVAAATAAVMRGR